MSSEIRYFILGHHTEQGTIRYIHHRIYRHHQKIEGIGIDTLAHRTEIRRLEQERETAVQWNAVEAFNLIYA